MVKKRATYSSSPNGFPVQTLIPSGFFAGRLGATLSLSEDFPRASGFDAFQAVSLRCAARRARGPVLGFCGADGVVFSGSNFLRRNGIGCPFTSRYKFSSFVRAHEVLRKNVRLEFMLGSDAKQLIEIRELISSQPSFSTSSVKIAFKVFPCRGSLSR